MTVAAKIRVTLGISVLVGEGLNLLSNASLPPGFAVHATYVVFSPGDVVFVLSVFLGIVVSVALALHQPIDRQPKRD